MNRGLDSELIGAAISRVPGEVATFAQTFLGPYP